jgi:hypothetical protein
LLRAGAALQADKAVMLFDNALRHPQTESSSFLRFRSEEGLEEMRAVVGADSFSSVADYYANSRFA